MTDVNLTTRYSGSHALVIGINDYESAPPLGYAVNDAEALASVLKDQFDFPGENVCLLIDNEATRKAIIERFLSFTSGGTNRDDRVVVFFAGHGHTVRSRKSEVGLLVPYDGDSKNLASLIRWDELTRNADLIEAKHILFLMDACYGGLAITRALKPGSMRFLKDMLLRPARQVLTAGKANEVVADLGGPLPDHSVFTGHLLEGLTGRASDSDGLITANGVMAYVYQRVGRDPESQQTPHYGYLDGDGDMIFSAPILSNDDNEEEKKGQDILVSIPAVITEDESEEDMTIIETAKEFLSDERYKIRLHGLVAQEIREVVSLTAEDYFPLNGSWSNDELVDRIKKYETITHDLCSIQALLAYWGSASHKGTLTLALKRICDRFKEESGLTVWLSIRWYPALLLLYTGGIAAVAEKRYDNLRELMQANIADPRHSGDEVTLIRDVFTSLSQDAFKKLPGHERHHVPLPRSEYLYKLLQPTLDDLLFFGTDYESHFDRFEVLLALECAEQCERDYGRVWGPVGRFGWKYQRSHDSSPLHQVIKEAEQYGASWPPIRAGLFGGSVERFQEIASKFSERVGNLGWL